MEVPPREELLLAGSESRPLPCFLLRYSSKDTYSSRGKRESVQTLLLSN